MARRALGQFDFGGFRQIRGVVRTGKFVEGEIAERGKLHGRDVEQAGLGEVAGFEFGFGVGQARRHGVGGAAPQVT